MMKKIGYGLLVILFIIVCVLSVLNSQVVSFNYLLGTMHLSLIILLVAFFIFGMVVGMFLTIWRGKKKRKQRH